VIDAKIAEMEDRRNMAEAEDVPKENERVGFSDVGTFDSDLYTGNKSKFEGYHTSLAMPDDDEEDDPMAGQAPKRATYTGKLFIAIVCILT
jgi:hypothetical protein